MFNWGKRSVKNINTVNNLLQILSQRLILVTPYDIGVLNSGGKRTAEEQNAIYQAGNSKCDGYKKLSYHQSGLAIDFVPYIDGKFTWANGKAFLTIAKLTLEIWEDMVLEGITEDYHLHWGGFWNAKDLDNDGLLEISDKLGWDGAHFELRKSPQRNAMQILV